MEAQMCITRIGLVVALILSAYSVARAQDVWVEGGTSFAPTFVSKENLSLKKARIEVSTAL